MKKLVFLFFSLVVASGVHAQVEMNPTHWQEDLRFLQKTVHDDYSFLFKKTTAKQFDQQVETLHLAIPTMQEHEIVTGLARIVASFGYGHTSLRPTGASVNFHRLPLNLYHFSDGVYVEGAHKDYQKIVGSKVIKVQGMPTDEALAAIRPVVPAENDQFFKAYGVLYLVIPEVLHAQGVTSELKSQITLTLEKDGKSFEETVTGIQGLPFRPTYGFTKQTDDWIPSRDQAQTPLYLKHLKKIYFFEYLPDQKAVYVRHSQIQDDPSESIPEFYERVFDFVEENDVEQFVLDLRLNGGGNNYKNKPIVTGILRSEKINQPGKLFVIIGRRTFSACQNLVNELDNYTNATFVGEPTSENINFYGDNRKVELPNSKIPVFLSFAWWQDKPQWENKPWTTPHVAVDMTFDDYRSNRDPVLDAALNFSGNDFVRDPIAYLRELFMANKLEEVRSEAKRMVNDPRYHFVDFEAEFNKAGYDLINDDQIDAAIFVLQQNTQLFPDSANAWDSLGEVHWKAGKTEKAVEYYNKAIELDPKGPIGDNARTMLKKIQAEKK